jgi:hypothetical protein
MEETNEMRYILGRAKEFGLEWEILESAIKHAREFEDASIEECLQVGAMDWDIT